MKSPKHEPAASKKYSSDISQGFGVAQEGTWGFPGGSNGKESACSADVGLILGLGRSPGEGNGEEYPSILAWKILWTEKSSRLQSMGSQSQT